MAARRLSHDDRVKIVILREEGYSVEAIASRMKCLQVCTEELPGISLC